MTAAAVGERGASDQDLRARIHAVFDQDRIVGLYEALCDSVDPAALDPPASGRSESLRDTGPAGEIGRIPWPA
ncbi:hypothetical protein ASF58_24605 [Methylobacterium sp. Leaf125]|nr:hypothetical protein ASF58_24605 [Methylobacterium sp. Leaf125]